MRESAYTNDRIWPHKYLRDKALEAFILCGARLAERYQPGELGGVVSILEEHYIGFLFNDWAMVTVCFADMIEGTLAAFDLLPYDIDEKVLQCFGNQLGAEEHNRRCAEYIQWVFSIDGEAHEAEWDIPKYQHVYSNAGCAEYRYYYRSKI